jgi:hypothetical protein
LGGLVLQVIQQSKFLFSLSAMGNFEYIQVSENIGFRRERKVETYNCESSSRRNKKH